MNRVMIITGSVIMEMELKKSLFVLSTLSALFLSADAYSAPAAELKVVGELSVPIYTVNATDNRLVSKSNAQVSAFGLGNVNGAGKIGYSTVSANKAMFDGVASYLFAYTPKSSLPEVPLSDNIKYGWETTTVLLGQKIKSLKFEKVFMADIEVTPFLASAEVMNGKITDSTDIDGPATLVFTYGI